MKALIVVALLSGRAFASAEDCNRLNRLETESIAQSAAVRASKVAADAICNANGNQSGQCDGARAVETAVLDVYKATDTDRYNAIPACMKPAPKPLGR